MLVVNRERFCRFARDMARASADLEQLPPPPGGFLVAARAARGEGEGAESVYSYRRD